MRLSARCLLTYSRSQFGPPAVRISRGVALGVALAGCAATVTDPASVSRTGRYDVTLPGAGVTLGGVLFRPSGLDGKAPAIIVLHGWAEAGVPGAPRVEGTARQLSEYGYVTL